MYNFLCIKILEISNSLASEENTRTQFELLSFVRLIFLSVCLIQSAYDKHELTIV